MPTDSEPNYTALLRDALSANPEVNLRAIRAMKVLLNQRELDILIDAYADGWSYGRLAQQTGMSRQAVAQRLNRGLTQRRPSSPRLVERDLADAEYERTMRRLLEDKGFEL